MKKTPMGFLVSLFFCTLAGAKTAVRVRYEGAQLNGNGTSAGHRVVGDSNGHGDFATKPDPIAVKLRKLGSGIFADKRITDKSFPCVLKVVSDPKDHGFEGQWLDGAPNRFACFWTGQTEFFRCQLDGETLRCNDLAWNSVQVLANGDLLVRPVPPDDSVQYDRTIRFKRMQPSQLAKPNKFQRGFSVWDSPWGRLAVGASQGEIDQIKQSVFQNLRSSALDDCYSHGWSYCSVIDGPRILNGASPAYDWIGTITVLGTPKR